MKYQALFFFTHNHLALTVQTRRGAPHPEVVRQADMLMSCDSREAVAVHKDRLMFFTEHPAVDESLVLDWLKAGRGRLGAEFQALMSARRGEHVSTRKETHLAPASQ